MSTVIVLWNEDPNSKPNPVGTSGTAGVERAKEWCQWQANQLACDVLEPLTWKHYLSRGTGPHSAHYTTSDPRYGIFEIWIVDELK